MVDGYLRDDSVHRTTSAQPLSNMTVHRFWPDIERRRFARSVEEAIKAGLAERTDAGIRLIPKIDPRRGIKKRPRHSPAGAERHAGEETESECVTPNPPVSDARL